MTLPAFPDFRGGIQNCQAKANNSPIILMDFTEHVIGDQTGVVPDTHSDSGRNIIGDM